VRVSSRRIHKVALTKIPFNYMKETEPTVRHCMEKLMTLIWERKLIKRISEDRVASRRKIAHVIIFYD
jgi:hypothetical protein